MTDAATSDRDMSDESLTDFALAASRDEGEWDVVPLPPRAAQDLDSLLAALRQLQTAGGVLGLVSVADDFFIAVRLRGDDIRLLLSDVSAATDWPIAGDVLDELDMSLPDEDDELYESAAPVGDFDIFADLGMPAMELTAVCEDLDLYPDEMLGRVAARLGFAEQFEAAVAAAGG